MKYIKTYENNNDEFKDFLKFLKSFINDILNKYNFSISGNYISFKETSWKEERYSFAYYRSVYTYFHIFAINKKLDSFNLQPGRFTKKDVPNVLINCVDFLENVFKLYGGDVNVSKIKSLEDYLSLERFDLYNATKKYNL